MRGRRANRGRVKVTAVDVAPWGGRSSAARALAADAVPVTETGDLPAPGLLSGEPRSLAS